MEMVFILLPLALLLAVLAVVGFIWATKRGQFDDLETPPLRMLFGDEKLKSRKKSAEHDGDHKSSAGNH